MYIHYAYLYFLSNVFMLRRISEYATIFWIVNSFDIIILFKHIFFWEIRIDLALITLSYGELILVLSRSRWWEAIAQCASLFSPLCYFGSHSTQFYTLDNYILSLNVLSKLYLKPMMHVHVTWKLRKLLDWYETSFMCIPGIALQHGILYVCRHICTLCDVSSL